MKKILSLIITLIFVHTHSYAGGGSKNCIDSSKMNPNAICPMVYAPVCGCDGVTYGNSCIAINSGVTSFINGECSPGGGVNNCFDPTLVDSNAICPTIYAPVCGCDGVTYSNDCEATKNGVLSFVPGTCSHSGGGNPNCVDSSLIDPNTACFMLYDPVCGCDGVTYGNACIAKYHYGITNFVSGECGIIGGDDCFIFPYFHYDIEDDHKTVQFMYFAWGSDPGAPNGGAPASSPFSVLWNFGDGTTSVEINPTHTYADSVNANYEVCLYVYDSLSGCSDSFCQVLKPYHSNDCLADFDWEIVYDSLHQTDSIVFINNTPISSDDSVVVIWSYGNGAVSLGNSPNTSYSYDEEGDYIVCMAVENYTTNCFEMICEVVPFRLSSVPETSLGKQLKMFPNPAADFLIINNPSNVSRLVVSNLQGQKIYERNLSNGFNRLDIAHLPTGLFFISFISDMGVSLQPLSIVR
jgi:hypothetical protein